MDVKSQKIALSYAREDQWFVSEVCAILRRFYGLANVFCYLETQAGFSPGSTGQTAKSAEIDDFYKFLQNADVLVCFGLLVPGRICDISPAQDGELKKWRDVINAREAGARRRHTILALLPGEHPGAKARTAIHGDPNRLKPPATDNVTIMVRDFDQSAAEQLAEKIIRYLLLGTTEREWTAGRNGQLFTYEKNMIDRFHVLARLTPEAPFISLPQEVRTELVELVKAGLPIRWPNIRLRTDSPLTANPLIDDVVGTPRTGISPLASEWTGEASGPDQVVAAALSKYHEDRGQRRCMLDETLCLLEAGPRKQLMQFNRAVHAGIVVSGGIAPGVNAVIDGIVQRHMSYHRELAPNEHPSILGFRHGLWGLAQGGASDDLRLPLTGEMTASHATEGGAFLETSRLEDLQNSESKLREIMNSLRGLDVLYVIGGDGTMKAAEMLTRRAAKERLRLSIVGVPKTMDNDVLWVWQSFGFATAVEKAREVISNLWTEVRSNPRVCVLQVFGSASGFVVSHAVLASPTHCDAALIPEVKFRLEVLIDRVAERIVTEQRAVPYGFIVMAETAVPLDAEKYMYDTRIGLTDGELAKLKAYLPLMRDSMYAEGSAHDDLRSGALKLVSRGLELGLKEKLRNNMAIHLDRLRVFTNEPRHILRATGPSFSDIIMGQRLGALAVDNAMAGYSDFMISQWLTEYVLVPLRLVALGRKRIPPDGIFWKSVLAKTGQGDLA
ncbi:MAG: 6-phosphofructokinase [Planctomycetes bacterium]|nr:6-phosphofructokinase [Planctomycetota bacterium]